VFEIRNLRHAYAERAVLAVEHWAGDQGSHHLLIGPSGCGKTTLLHCLGLLLKPSEGVILIAGQDAAALSGGARDAFRGRAVGLVFQKQHLIGALSVRKNLRLARELAGRPHDDALLERIAGDLGLKDLMDARPARLSAGEAQRAALARALVAEPKLILADEPTANLDDANAEAVAGLLTREAQRHGATLIIATHDARLRPHFSNVFALSAPGREAHKNAQPAEEMAR